MGTVTLTIDGQELSVPDESTVLQAAEAAGVDIPTLCYHPSLQAFNSCLLCVVEVEGARRPLLACGTQARDGMVVHTRTELIRDTRRVALELLVSEHCGDCVAPCRLGCPAHCDIQGFIRAIVHEDFAEAIRIIKEDIPLPVSLGRVCPAPCEDACRRDRVEESVSICALKRFPADWDLENGPFLPDVLPDSGFKVAIVGAGPAGLSAAYYLRQLGHAVTIFEAQDEAGGMLRYGIPSYRLPRPELAAEVAAITALGVDIRYGIRVGRDVTVDHLRQEYDALFLGIGAWSSRPMKVPGEELENVWGGIDLLGAVARGEPVDVGRRVIVVGGGNTAIDASRTVLRMGAESSIFYRRSREQMPALDLEVDEAEEEGVQFNLLVTPTSIEKSGTGLKVTSIRMELGEPDASGRRRPLAIPGSEVVVECDTVVMAIGQQVDLDGVTHTDLEISRWGTIVADEQTMRTSLPGVFAGGDAVTGPDVAVRAVGAGHSAALSIDQYLHGKEVVGRPSFWNVSMGDLDAVTEKRFSHVDEVERASMPHLEINKRRTTFSEVALGFDATLAVAEAKRCLSCGCAAIDDCDLRNYSIEYQVDPEFFGGASKEYALDNSHSDLVHEPGKCILCGMCVRVCRDVKKLNVFAFANRGFSAVVEPYFGMPLGDTVCDGCLECVKVCPTGALMSREQSFYAYESGNGKGL